MKTYFCSKINEDIKLDGNLDKAVWQAAEAVELFDNATGGVPRQGTDARLLWNDSFLYIAFACRDDYINSTLTGYNDKLYDEEVVEVFIDDNCDMKTYIEIEVNPLNALLHYSIQNNLQGRGIGFGRVEKTVMSAVKRDDANQVWSVEIAIPFNEFITAANIPPKAGDRWLLNLYRIDRPKDGKDEFSAWSPTERGSYHTPQKFGELIFRG